MLKGTALRRMVMSLLETGRHHMTVVTISLWARNPTSCLCLSSFPLNKRYVLLLLLFWQSSSISFHRVQGCSICTWPFRVLVPGVSLLLLATLSVLAPDGDRSGTVCHGQITTWPSTSLSRSNTWPLSSSWNPSALLTLFFCLLWLLTFLYFSDPSGSIFFFLSELFLSVAQNN